MDHADGMVVPIKMHVIIYRMPLAMTDLAFMATTLQG